MALINLKFASEVLGMQTEINVIVPQKSTKGQIGMKGEAKGDKYKTLLLLHGLSDDSSTWLRRSSIERYATENGIAVTIKAKSFVKGVTLRLPDCYAYTFSDNYFDMQAGEKKTVYIVGKDATAESLVVTDFAKECKHA